MVTIAYWLQGLIILWEKYKSFWQIIPLSFILFSSLILAQESFQFDVGDRINVIADHSSHLASKKLSKASGNVIITHKDETLYGEMATFDRESGNISIQGGVRYLAPDVSLYGSKLKYNTQTRKLTIYDSRIIHQDYTVFGKKIVRVNANLYLADEAEYSTCRDCPEAWTVYGRKVSLVPGQYIHLSHALIKVKGVPVLYLPYMVIPIKTGRQTGLLFPNISMNFSEGITYQQPWYWAISGSKDMTIAPAIWGRRGYGGAVEYRQSVGENKWFEFHSMVNNDRIYLPGKFDSNVSGEHYFRHYSRYEHHFEFGKNLTHHFRYSFARDLDFFRDFRRYTEPEISGSEVGGGGFIDWRSSFLTISTEAHYNQNQLVRNAAHFDDRYVQILPKINATMTPITLWQPSLPFLGRIIVGGDASMTMFKQNSLEELSARRNAQRYSWNPFVQVNVVEKGPIHLGTKVAWDGQQYNFRQDHEASFSKSATLVTSDLTLELSKIYGVASVERHPLDQLDNGEEQTSTELFSKTKKVPNTIGQLPPFEKNFNEEFLEKKKHAFRHLQQIRFLHYYIANQTYSGNAQFRDQIQNNLGLFDYRDALRAQEQDLGPIQSRTIISPTNSLELQWNNSLIKKTPGSFNPMNDERYLRDNFAYSKTAFFNFSQGVEMQSMEKKFSDRLTRMHLSGGLQFNRATFSFDEYYFHQNGKNVSSLSLDKYFSFASLGGSFYLNSLSYPRNENLNIRGSIRPWDSVTLSADGFYDLSIQAWLSTHYNVLLSPRSNCWKISFDYVKTLIDNRFTFNLLFNLGGGKFQGVQPGK